MELSRTFFSVLGKSKELNSRISFFLPAIQIREYAARKGTREKARKKKVKVEIKKVGFIPHNLRAKNLDDSPHVSKRIKDSHMPFPEDDVWLSRFHKFKIYDFASAVEAHRETHHPQIYNKPDANINAFIELNMQGVKKNKFVEPFNKIAGIPHPFEHGEKRSILVFCKTPETKEEAENAGANLVGDADFVKKIQRGNVTIPDFNFILAHPNILAELVTLKAIFKKKFPSLKDGTLSPNIENLVKTFRNGIHYFCSRDEKELDYGWIETPFGKLDMKTEELEENFKSLLQDVNSKRPKREGPFITRVFLKCEPSVEKFKINLSDYIDEEEEIDIDSDDDDEKAQKKA